SGGEQQMVAIGRALMSNPKLLLCDEISLGLAPIVVRQIYARLPSIVAEGSSLVIVEQDVVQALKAANQVYCLQEGRVALAGAAATLTGGGISAASSGGWVRRGGTRRAPPLSPPAGRAQAAFGRRSWRKERRCEASAMERSERVRGALRKLNSKRIPLTPTLSPQAGGGGGPQLLRASWLPL